jgi:hypothetical protein
MPSEPFLGLGLRGSRTPADPGSSKSEPEMTEWPSSRSRSTNSRRRASIWACKARRPSETACSLLVSCLKREANSSRASECGSGKATTRLILGRQRGERRVLRPVELAVIRAARKRMRTQCCFHEHAETLGRPESRAAGCSFAAGSSSTARGHCFRSAASICPRRGRALLGAEAVAQILGSNDFLYVSDKEAILRRVNSVSEGPLRPAEARLWGRRKVPLSFSYNRLGLCDSLRGTQGSSQKPMVHRTPPGGG